METKTKLRPKKTAEIKRTTPEIKKRGLVGVWKGKIKINGDIDNVFNLAFTTDAKFKYYQELKVIDVSK